MRLLITTDLAFRDFLGSDVESYAILSHCWSHVPGQEEPTHQQVVAGEVQVDSCGWKKVTRCCDIAREPEGRDGLGLTLFASTRRALWISAKPSILCTLGMNNQRSARFSWTTLLHAKVPTKTLLRQGVATFIYILQHSGTADGSLEAGLSKSFLRLFQYPSILRMAFFCVRGLNLLRRQQHTTGIQSQYILKERPVNQVSVVQRMCWASNSRLPDWKTLRIRCLGFSSQYATLVR
jgi:hypothetical protein